MKNRGILRYFVQFTFFALVLTTAINHTLVESGINIPLISEASVHVLCPFGAIVSLYKLVTTGSFVNKIHESAMVIMGITLFLSVLFGPVFCGWVCPLGSLQEFISNISKRFNLFGKIKISQGLNQYLKNMRYIVLLWALYVTAKSGQLIFADYDPYYALFNFWSGEVAASAILILVTTLTLALFIERPWCKYACPLGALLGLTNKFRLFKLRRNTLTCTSCNLCNETCPVGIDISANTTIKDTHCISCLKCTSEQQCPENETLVMQIGGVKNAR